MQMHNNSVFKVKKLKNSYVNKGMGNLRNAKVRMGNSRKAGAILTTVVQRNAN